VVCEETPDSNGISLSPARRFDRVARMNEAAINDAGIIAANAA